MKKNVLVMKVILILILMTGLSCSLNKDVEVPKKSKVLIMDLQMPDTTKPGSHLEGWWFGSRDVFESENSGTIFSDHLAKNMDLKYFTLFPRLDFKYYMLEKKETIAKEFPKMEEKDILKMMQNASPVDYGKYLQTDLVITGKVITSNLAHNRTIHWWRSLVEVELEIYDVEKATKIRTITGRKKKMFYSTDYTMNLLAQELAKDIKDSIK